MTRPMNVLQIRNALETPSRFDMIETLRLTGWATDGRWAMRLPPEFAARVLSKKHDEGGKRTLNGRALTKEQIESAFNVTRPVAASMSDGDESTTVCRTKSRTAYVSAKYVATVRKHHPDATPYMNDCAGTPVVFRTESGETVGAVIPLARAC